MKKLLPLLMILAAVAAAEDWPQWGGPNRNFKVAATGLANSWPAGGPRTLWSRALGEGYSAIAGESGVLYTMYREAARFWQFGKEDQEVVVALDAGSGKTIWEYRYDAVVPPRNALENGPGPHSTPLIAGDRLYTAGILGKFLCLDKKTGRILWGHDLFQEFQATKMGRGYANSAIAYKNTVILPVGGAGHAVMAFDQKTGAVVWKKQDFHNAFSSPIVINVSGQDQLVVFMGDEIAGLDPNNGNLLWRNPHHSEWGIHVSTPVWGEDNLLFYSSAYGGGSHALQLSQAKGITTAKEIWSNSRMHVHISTVVRVGDYVYGSSGDFGPAFLIAVNAKTGMEAWRSRDFGKANFIYADGKLILLDEDGRLALATVSQQGLKVVSKVDLLTRNAWTAPTLIGSTLYVRDRKNIMALDLR